MKDYIVIDTNVFVSFLRSRKGASYKLWKLAREGKENFALSLPLALEYIDAGQRADTVFTSSEVEYIVEDFCSLAKRQNIYYLWRPFLKDSKDDHVLELAVASGAKYIVTFNKKDFAKVYKQFGIEVLAPAEYLRRMEDKNVSN